MDRKISLLYTERKQVLDTMLVLAAPNLLRRRGSALDTPAAHYLTRSRPPELHQTLSPRPPLPPAVAPVAQHIAFIHLDLLPTHIAHPQARRLRPAQRICTR